MADIPVRYLGLAPAAFRPGGPGSDTYAAIVTVPPAQPPPPSQANIGAVTGCWQFRPFKLNPTRVSTGPVPPAGQPMQGWGWRDESYSIVGQATQRTVIFGTWQVIYYLELNPGVLDVIVGPTIIVYAVNGAGVGRELFRRTAPFAVLPPLVALPYVDTFDPGVHLLNPAEVLHYEFYVGVTVNPNVAENRIGLYAGAGLVPGLGDPSIDGPSILLITGGPASASGSSTSSGSARAVLPAARALGVSVSFGTASAVRSLTAGAHFSTASAGTATPRVPISFAAASFTATSAGGAFALAPRLASASGRSVSSGIAGRLFTVPATISLARPVRVVELTDDLHDVELNPGRATVALEEGIPSLAGAED